MGSTSSTRSGASLTNMTDNEIDEVVRRETMQYERTRRKIKKNDAQLAKEIDQCCEQGRPLDIAFLRSIESLYKNNPSRLSYFFDLPKFFYSPPIYVAIDRHNWDIAEFLLAYSPNHGKILTNSYHVDSTVYNASWLILQDGSFEFLQRIIDKGYVNIQDVSAQWNNEDLRKVLVYRSDEYLYRLAALADKHLFDRLLDILSGINTNMKTDMALIFLGYDHLNFQRKRDYQRNPTKYEEKFLRMKEAKREILLKGFYSPEVTPFTWLHEDDGLVGLTSRIILENTAFHLRQDAESSM